MRVELLLRARLILVNGQDLRLGLGLLAELPVRRPGVIVLPDQRPVLLRGGRPLDLGCLARLARTSACFPRFSTILGGESQSDAHAGPNADGQHNSSDAIAIPFSLVQNMAVITPSARSETVAETVLAAACPAAKRVAARA